MSGAVSEQLRAALYAFESDHVTWVRQEQGRHRAMCRCNRWTSELLPRAAAHRAEARHLAEASPVPVEQQCADRRSHWTRPGWPCPLCAGQLALPGLEP